MSQTTPTGLIPHTLVWFWPHPLVCEFWSHPLICASDHTHWAMILATPTGPWFWPHPLICDPDIQDCWLVKTGRNEAFTKSQRAAQCETDHLVTWLARITEFKMPFWYDRSSIKDGFHRCIVILCNTSLRCIWAPPLLKVQLYCAPNTGMQEWLAYEKEYVKFRIYCQY